MSGSIRKELKALPFVEEQPGGTLNLWAAPKCEDWAEGIRIGVEYATLAIEVAKKHKTRIILVNIVGAMVERGTWGSVEVGFVDAIASRLS